MAGVSSEIGELVYDDRTAVKWRLDVMSKVSTFGVPSSTALSFASTTGYAVVWNFSALFWFPDTDAEDVFRPDEREVLPETGLLPEKRKNLFLEEGRELLLFSKLELKMNVPRERHGSHP